MFGIAKLPLNLELLDARPDSVRFSCVLVLGTCCLNISRRERLSMPGLLVLNSLNSPFATACGEDIKFKLIANRIVVNKLFLFPLIKRRSCCGIDLVPQDANQAATCRECTKGYHAATIVSTRVPTRQLCLKRRCLRERLKVAGKQGGSAHRSPG